ncbi:uncharacterized protein PODANS_4_6200 [Podospora anserina S mat+]|uniref:Podospora anserina S mat+ genomic DNA chromosome 4, supercontig 4 n=1 Tax=Podospora anserina (strain S / ATCC MYA-4624 / DSM 980 / FGSC 10383) TaxID=515849 RepID=B2APV0_PODAN|nr:uncharacterized protein PODANS_4_6200 [Podospora anserina S mat+]CAP66889.1 unnamed protein product [Podospora anserina S mat+]CDP28631.1 Putative protein of unknown function [Podospora anserina S mat+]
MPDATDPAPDTNMTPSVNNPSSGSSPAPIILRSATQESEFNSLIFSRIFNHRRPDLSSSTIRWQHSRHPYAYCKPLTVSDVVACVDFARKKDKRIAIRSGGHSWACWSIRYDSILLDMIDFEGGVGSIRWEREMGEGVVSCGPAVTSGGLNEFLAEGGRMFPGGHCPDVGLGGFLLQGGMGWNCKTKNKDLFHAARGAGPAFPAVVTRFYMKTLSLLPMWQSLYFFDITKFKEVLEWLIKLSPTASPTLEIVLVSSFVPQSSPTPTLTAVFTSFAPSHTAALSALTPIHTSLPCPPSASPNHPSRFCEPTSLPEEYAAQLAGNAAPGFRTRSDNAYLSNDLSPAQVAAALDPAFSSLPTKQSTALWFSMNPTSRRVWKGNMMLSMQSDHYFSVYAVWEEEKDDGVCDGWVRDVFARLEEQEGTLAGSYLGDADFQFRKAGGKFWGEGRGDPRDVKAKWDGEGRICGLLEGHEALGEGVRG